VLAARPAPDAPAARARAGPGAGLQVLLQHEQVVVEEKKAATQTLIESIGREKAVVDEAVEASRGDEEAAARLQARRRARLKRMRACAAFHFLSCGACGSQRLRVFIDAAAGRRRR